MFLGFNSNISIQHLFRISKILKRCFFIFLFCHNISAQEYSNSYLTIKNDARIVTTIKEHKLDSLFATYKTSSPDSILVNDFYDYALWHYYNTQNLKKAIVICNRGILLANNLKKKGLRINEDKLAGMLYNIGFFEEKLGNYSTAFGAYKLVTTTVKIDKRVARSYNRMGECKRVLGDYYTAINYYDRAITLAKTYSIVDLVNFCINASTNLKQIERPFSINKGILLLNDVLSRNLENISPRRLIQVYDNLGSLNIEKKNPDFDLAALNYKKGITIANKYSDSVQLGYLYNNLGYLHVKINSSKAIDYLNKAHTYTKDVEVKSICFSNKAQYFSKIQDKINTLQNSQQAINLLAPFNPKTLFDNPSHQTVFSSNYKTELLDALVEKAKYHIKFRDPKNPNKYLINALSTLNLADKLVDNIRYESDEEQSKLFWRETASSIYTNAVKVCFLLNDNENAFYFIEKNKAVLLLEDITSKQRKKKANIPVVIAKSQKNYKNKIALIQNKRSISRFENEKDSLNRLLIETKNQYGLFVDSLKSKYPNFHKTLNPPKIEELNEVQKSVSKTNTAYISYILNKDDGYGLLVSEDESLLFQIKQVNTLLELSKTYRKLIEFPFTKQSQINHFTTTSYLLYKKLFPEPVNKVIQGKKIIIIPDSYLQNLPFEAFITSEKNKEYLIQSNELSYAYSVTFLNENKNIIRKNTNEFLGIAPIQFSKNLSKLAKSKTEVETISKLFKSKTLINSQATVANYKAHSKNYNIIHFATHANTNDTINPWIAFSDKKMTLNDLYLTNNTADLVVLSACKTSLGELNQGEGVMSLARGFFNTGANSVISTLWNVNDKSSSKIITEFYEEFRKGRTKSEALRLAKLKYIDSHQLSEISPYYWASFVLIGDATALPSINRYDNILFILGSILLLFLSCILYRKLKK